MAQARLEQSLNREWWALVIRGALWVAGGIFIIARPLASVAALALVIAIWALMQGIVTIVHAFDLRRVARHWWLLLVNGAVGVLFGVAALYYYPGLSHSFLVVWASWWLLIGGVAGITIGMAERRAGMSWGWTMTWGIVGVTMSAIAFANPPATITALVGVLATFGVIA